jgi:hypothetical protein
VFFPILNTCTHLLVYFSLFTFEGSFQASKNFVKDENIYSLTSCQDCTGLVKNQKIGFNPLNSWNRLNFISIWASPFIVHMSVLLKTPIIQRVLCAWRVNIASFLVFYIQQCFMSEVWWCAVHKTFNCFAQAYKRGVRVCSHFLLTLLVWWMTSSMQLLVLLTSQFRNPQYYLSPNPNWWSYMLHMCSAWMPWCLPDWR